MQPNGRASSRITQPAVPPASATPATPGASPQPTITPAPTVTVEPTATADPTPAPGGSPTVAVSADVAGATSGTNDDATANLLAAMNPTVIAPTGDLVYEDGSAAQFAACYEPTWGRFKDKTRPAPGNHEYHQTNAGPYFDYFGAAAGARGKGWYSYDVGPYWHAIALNSNVSMGSTSEQITWLKADLAANPDKCLLAYWHRPRWSSGTSHGSSTTPHYAVQALYSAGADLVLVSHDHNYERFAPQNPSGGYDPIKGLREFVVGTGGAPMNGFNTPLPNSEVRSSSTYGVLKLTLKQGSYDWKFERAAGGTFTDLGSSTCHNVAAPAG